MADLNRNGIDDLLDQYLNPWSYSTPRAWEYTPYGWPEQPAPTTTVAPAAPTVTAPKTQSTNAGGGYSYANVDPAVVNELMRYAVSAGAGRAANNPVAQADVFEKRAMVANINDAVKQQTLGNAGTDGMTTEEYKNMVVDAFLNGNGNNNNGGGGTVQRVLSPEQVQSLVDTLGAQTAMAGQGVGKAYDQANKEMARLMRQYSQAEKMNRAGAQGTLTAFGVRPSAYKVGDFGAPEMLAGARANLIGSKAAEMANWQNQQALYQQLLKDMGG